MKEQKAKAVASLPNFISGKPKEVKQVEETEQAS